MKILIGADLIQRSQEILNADVLQESIQVLRQDSKKIKLSTLQNFLECEAHLEVLTQGIQDNIRQRQ